jgi:hypothetical protein
MADTVSSREITAPAIALRVGASRERVIRWIQTGRLLGRQDSTGRWLATEGAVEALIRQLGRGLVPAAPCGALRRAQTCGSPPGSTRRSNNPESDRAP